MGHGLVEVDPQYRRESHKVQQHIGKLVTNRPRGLRVVCHHFGLLLGQPLEDLDQLPHLAGRAMARFFGE